MHDINYAVHTPYTYICTYVLYIYVSTYIYDGETLEQFVIVRSSDNDSFKYLQLHIATANICDWILIVLH